MRHLDGNIQVVDGKIDRSGRTVRSMDTPVNKLHQLRKKRAKKYPGKFGPKAPAMDSVPAGGKKPCLDCGKNNDSTVPTPQPPAMDNKEPGRTAPQNPTSGGARGEASEIVKSENKKKEEAQKEQEAKAASASAFSFDNKYVRYGALALGGIAALKLLSK